MTTTGGEDREVGSTDELFEELVREHGQKGAAARLGVGYQTVRRSLKAGRPSPRLRSALEYHILRRDRGGKSVVVGSDARSAHDADAVGAVDDGNETREGNGIAVLGETGLRHLEHAQLEGELSELPPKKLVAVLAIKVERLERYLASVQSGGTDQSPAVPSGPEPGSGRAATPGKSAAAGEAVAEGREPTTPRETSDGVLGAVTLDRVAAPEDVRAAAAREEALLEKWRKARILESSAKTDLERAAARERTLQIETAIIWERDKTVPLRDTWNAIKRDREWEWRWRALSEVSRKRRQLARRQRLRCFLSLGLWRS